MNRKDKMWGVCFDTDPVIVFPYKLDAVEDARHWRIAGRCSAHVVPVIVTYDDGKAKKARR